MSCLSSDCIWVSTCILDGIDQHQQVYLTEQGYSSSPVFSPLFQYSHCHLGIVSVGKHTFLHTCAETQQVFLLRLHLLRCNSAKIMPSSSFPQRPCRRFTAVKVQAWITNVMDEFLLAVSGSCCTSTAVLKWNLFSDIWYRLWAVWFWSLFVCLSLSAGLCKTDLYLSQMTWLYIYEGYNAQDPYATSLSVSLWQCGWLIYKCVCVYKYKYLYLYS